MNVEMRRRLWFVGSILFVHIPLIVTFFTIGYFGLLYIWFPSAGNAAMYEFVDFIEDAPLTFLTLISFILCFAFLGYIFGWRVAFPDYRRITANINDKSEAGPENEGRIYWVNNFGISKKINDWLERDDKERETVVWVAFNWPWNIFLPTRSLVRIRGIRPEDVWRDGFLTMKIRTRGGMKFVQDRLYVIGDSPLEQSSVPVTQSDLHISSFLNRTERDSKSASKADPMVIKKQLEDRCVSINDPLYNSLATLLPIEGDIDER